MPSSTTTPPVVYYERLVEEAIASGSAEVATDRASNVVRVSPDIRVGDILSLLSLPSLAPTSYIATFLALMDFNNRNSSFDSNLPELTKDCDFYMTIRYRSPHYNPVQAASFFQDEYLINKNDTRESMIPPPAMAVLGPTRSVEAELVAKMGGSIPDQEASSDDPNNDPDRVNHYSIPNIAATATSAQLEDRSQYPYFARTTPTNRVDALALGYYLKSIGVRRLAVLHVSDSYGRAYLAGLREVARVHDIRLLVVSYTDQMVESLRGAITTLKLANYSYNMLIPTSSDKYWIPVMRALYDASLIGVPEKMWFFADTVGAFDKIIEEPWLGHAMNRSAGVYITSTVEANRAMNARWAPFLESDEWLEYFLSKQVTGHLVDMPNVTQFRSQYSDKIFAHLPALMSYDAVMALGLAACRAPQEFFTGPELYEALKGVRFRGASGEISFDQDTATRPFAYAGIYNVIVNENATWSGPGIKSMVVNPENGHIEVLHPLLFTDGSTTPPPSLDPLVENRNLLTRGERAACLALAGIVLLSAAGCAIWTAINRERPAVKASQPTFLFVLAMGAFILAASIIPATFQEPMPMSVLDAGCMSTIWLASLGFSTGFSGLFSKTLRIHRVFTESRKGRRIQVQVKDVLKPVLLLLATNVVLLIVWTVVSPLRWSRVPTEVDSYGRTMNSIGTCMRLSEPAQIAFLSLTIGVNFAALCLSNWMTYKARNLPAQFNDNPYVAITNIVLLECAILGAPILFVTSGDPSSFVVVNSLLLAIISAAILLPIVLPLTLKPRARSIRRIDFNASNSFDQGKAQCSIGHYSAARPGGAQVQYGANQVRVSGLTLPSSRTGTSTTTGYSTLHASGRSSYQSHTLRKSGGSHEPVEGSSHTLSKEIKPINSLLGHPSLPGMRKARSGVVPKQDDVAITKATLNHQVRNKFSTS